MTYKLNPKYAHLPQVITNGLNGRAVNLAGKPAEKTIPATKDKPEGKVTIPAATTEDFAYIYEKLQGRKDGVVIKVQKVASKEGAKENTKS